VSVGIAFGGVADIAAFDITDDFDTQRLGLRQQRIIDFNAFPEVFFKIGNIDFDRRNYRSDDFQRADTKFKYGIDCRRQIGFAIAASITQVLGQPAIDRVQAHDQGRAFLFYHFGQSICKMTCHKYILSFGSKIIYNLAFF